MTQQVAATKGRNFRTFLLMEQFAAREIGARIAQARRERSLTQAQLAEVASFSARSLQDYESGLTIPYKHLRELGRLLKRPTEWFLYGDDEEKGEMQETLTLLKEQLVDVRGDLHKVLAELHELKRSHEAPPPLAAEEQQSL